MTNSIEADRAAFEAAAKDEGFYFASWNGPGVYEDAATECAWVGWKLARAQVGGGVSVVELKTLCLRFADSFGDPGWNSDHEDATKAVIIQIQALIAKADA